jgi:hypothetical protein
MAKTFLIIFQNLAIVPHDNFSPERRNVQQIISHFGIGAKFCTKKYDWPRL